MEPCDKPASVRTFREKNRQNWNGKAPVDDALLPQRTSERLLQRGVIVDDLYADETFVCTGCLKSQVWTAWQQKWWYEVAQGHVLSQPARCWKCRLKARLHRETAKRTHLEGLERKHGQQTKN